MGIKDIPGVVGRTFFKKELAKSEKPQKKNEEVSTKETTAKAIDSVELTDAKIAIEKENILASRTSIEDFDQAKSVLASVLENVDANDLIEIHGNADKIKTFLIM